MVNLMVKCGIFTDYQFSRSLLYLQILRPAAAQVGQEPRRYGDGGAPQQSGESRVLREIIDFFGLSIDPPIDDNCHEK